MPTQSEMKAVAQKYIDSFNSKDAKALASLFADNARIEDPVGFGRILEGREAIDNMYEYAVQVLEEAKLEAPITGSHGNCAAFAFSFVTNVNGIVSKTNCIEIMTFDESCKIIDMKAYWGSEDNSKNLGAGDYVF